MEKEITNEQKEFYKKMTTLNKKQHKELINRIDKLINKIDESLGKDKADTEDYSYLCKIKEEANLTWKDVEQIKRLTGAETDYETYCEIEKILEEN